MAAFVRVRYGWAEVPLSAWESGFPLAVIATTVYLLGIPLLLVALVRPRSRNRWLGRVCQCGWMCKTPSMRQSALRPLLRGYRPGAGYLWEPVVGPTWKVLLNAAVVFGADYRSAQVWCIFGLLVALLAAFTAVRPYAAGGPTASRPQNDAAPRHHGPHHTVITPRGQESARICPVPQRRLTLPGMIGSLLGMTHSAARRTCFARIY